MGKPILIDALHINMGGAFMILNYFVDCLIARGVNFVLLKDCRCPKLRSEDIIPQTVTMESSERTRYKYYMAHRYDFSKILSLCNIPPTIKMPVPVFTYIHNVSLLKIPKSITFKQKLKNRLKRAYIRHYAKNTDAWIVQTDNTATIVNQYINRQRLPVYCYPFYCIPNDINRTPVMERRDYVFIGEYTGAKGHEYLIEAWRILAEKGIFPILHLTCNSQKVTPAINQAKKSGAKIENHGFVNFEKVIELYNRSKATVYPSLNESLGLGIIEAASAGCDVIGCDLPYTRSVCKPSEVFSSCNAQSIADAVERYEQSNSPKTVLLIKDQANELINKLTKI